MAHPTSVFIFLLAVLTFEGFVPITEGVPQQRLHIRHQVKRDTNSYQDDYDTTDYDEDYKSDDRYDVDKDKPAIDPNIVTQGNTYTVDKGTTIRLPCYVDKFPKDSYSIMWRKADGEPNHYLVVGNMIMDKTQDHRMRVEITNDEDIKTNDGSVPHKGSTLLIPTAKAEDEGQYVCIVPRSTGETREIKHTVSIRDPPTITKEPSNGLVRVKKDDSVTMACYGQGRPKPTMKWHRLNKMDNRVAFADGRKEIEADELTFNKVDRHHGGIYECVADNGYGKPATQQIELEVEYAPEVTAQEIFVHAKSGNNVELICNVHAHPNPTVQWFKNRMELTDETAQLKQHGHKHILNIPSVAPKDFGNYTCKAINKFGESLQTLEISGKAGFAKFDSRASGTEATTFVLEWTSESHSDIQHFELKWREHGDTSWHSETIQPNRKSSYEWTGKLAIQDLKEATRYEATVAAQNEEDWSRHSPVYHFATFGAEPLKDPSSSTTTQLFLSNLLSSRSQILLSVIVAYFLTRWNNQL